MALLKVRKITTKNKSGDSYGITIPRHIAIRYENVYFRVLDLGGKLVLESGCKKKW